MRWLASIVFVFIAIGIVCAQSLTADIAKARSIKLLDTNASDLVKLFGPASPFAYKLETFSTENSRLTVSYATGKCTTGESYGVVASDWDVEAGKVVTIQVIPREQLTVEQLDLGGVKLQSEQLFRGIDDYRIHYNKAEGIAVVTFEGYVDEIRLFPAKSSYSRLCNDKKIQSYYSKANWKRDPRPKMICILRNQYANVVDVSLTETSAHIFNIKTTAIDPENDILTYNYRVSAGRVIGNGFNVIWDLTGEAPGTYTILVGVDDGAGIVGRTLTKAVILR